MQPPPEGFPPVPFTSQQIQRMTDPAEQERAHAVLTDYIARLRQMVAEQAEVRIPFGRVTAGNEDDPINRSDYQPGGLHGGWGGHSRFHPYQRPTHHAPAHKNISVVFSNTYTRNVTSRSNSTSLTKSGVAPPKSEPEPEPERLCCAFTSKGVCTRHACRFDHNPRKTAICKSFLYKGTCPNGDNCPLSHDPSGHNAPTCQHFQQGRCTKEDCRFAHVKINAEAQNCQAFGITGYCEKGAACSQLHAHECPFFANKKFCFYGDDCRLGHVRRAARLRMPSRRSSEGPSSPPDTTEDVEDAEGTAPNDTPTGRDNCDTAKNPHQFTQQADFVSLSSGN